MAIHFQPAIKVNFPSVRVVVNGLGEYMLLEGRVISSLLILDSYLCLIFHLTLPGQYKLWIVTSSDIGMSMLSEQTKTWSHGA